MKKIYEEFLLKTLKGVAFYPAMFLFIFSVGAIMTTLQSSRVADGDL